MSDFELRPPPGAQDPLVPRKPVRKAAHGPARASLQRFSCPCGCGRSRWFSQPRTPRSLARAPLEQASGKPLTSS
jgi:hypothetical protein